MNYRYSLSSSTHNTEAAVTVTYSRAETVINTSHRCSLVVPSQWNLFSFHETVSNCVRSCVDGDGQGGQSKEVGFGRTCEASRGLRESSKAYDEPSIVIVFLGVG